MSTTNLGIAHIAASQNAKEVTANEAFNALDNAGNQKVFFPMADGNVTLTQEELASGMVIVVTGALSADRNLNLPAYQRLFIFENATTGGYDVVVQVPSSPGSSVTVPASSGLIVLYSDGQDVIQITGGSSSVTPNSDTLPDLYEGPDPVPASPNAADDEFEGVALGGDWTLYNSTDLTVTVAQSRVSASVLTQTGYQARGFFKTAPAATFEFTAKISWSFMAPVSVYGRLCLTLRESATDKLAAIGVATTSSGAAEGSIWSDGTSGPGAPVSYSPLGLAGTMYLRIKDDGSNIIMSVSPDGVVWQVVKTVAVTTAFTTSPDQVGFILNDASNDGGTRYYSIDWIRRTL